MSPCLLRFNLLMSPCLLRTSESIDVHKVTRTKIKIVCDKPKTQIRTTHTQEKSCGARVAHAALRYTLHWGVPSHSRPVTEHSDLSRTAAFVRLRDLTRLMIPTVNPVRFHRGQRPGLFASLSTGYGPARVQANAVSLDHVARDQRACGPRARRGDSESDEPASTSTIDPSHPGRRRFVANRTPPHTNT